MVIPVWPRTATFQKCSANSGRWAAGSGKWCIPLPTGVRTDVSYSVGNFSSSDSALHPQQTIYTCYGKASKEQKIPNFNFKVI